MRRFRPEEAKSVMSKQKLCFQQFYEEFQDNLVTFIRKTENISI